MKITKTEFKMEFPTSWIIYICKDAETANAIYSVEMTKKDMLDKEWYYSVSMLHVHSDCRVPEFFRERGYTATIVGHNDGDWDKERTYTLYIVE